MRRPRRPAPSLVAAFLLAGTALHARAAEPWSPRASLTEARQEVAVAALEGAIYVIGGFRADVSVADTVEVYDPNTDSWSFAASLPTGLHHAAAAAVDGKLYVIGGFTDALFLAPVDSVLEYDPVGDSWTPKAPMPSARGALAVAVIDGRIYAAGGSPAARESDFAVYDPAANSWTALPDLPTPRNHLAAGATGGRFYAVGGRSGGIGGITAILEEYDPGSGQWSAATSMPTARGGIAGAVFENRLYVFGGEGNPDVPSGVFSETESYDPNTDTWQVHTPMTVPRHGIGAALLDGLIYIPGGATLEGLGVSGAHDVFDPLAPPPTVVPTLPPWGTITLALLLLSLGLRAHPRAGRGLSSL